MKTKTDATTERTAHPKNARAQTPAHKREDSDAALNRYLLRWKMAEGLPSTDVDAWPESHLESCLVAAQLDECAPAVKHLEAALDRRRKAAGDRTGLAATIAAGEAVIEGAKGATPAFMPSYSTRGGGPGRSAALISIPIGKVVPDPANARKSYEVNALNDLAASIRARGILEPLIVVRSKVSSGGTVERYRIVAGHRRRRAAEIAGLTEVPCVVRDDLQETGALAALVENLQREDLSPLEEAEAYTRVMAERNLSAAALAQEIGKGARYVQQRAAIATGLIKPAREWLGAGKITASHADELARLAPAYQDRIWKSIVQNRWDGAVPTLRELRERIARDRRKLHGAPWKLDEPAPTNGAIVSETCGACPHNTGGQKPVCENPTCYEARLAATLKLAAEGMKASGAPVRLISKSYLQPEEKKALPKGKLLDRYAYEPAKAGEKGAVLALDVESGKTKWLKKQAGRSYGDSATHKRALAEQRRHKEKERKEKEAFEAKVVALLPKVRGPLPYTLRIEVAWMMLRRMWSDVSRPVLKRHGWDKIKDDWSGKKLRAEVEKLDSDGLARLELEICLQWAEPSPNSYGKHKGKAKDLATMASEIFSK